MDSEVKAIPLVATLIVYSTDQSAIIQSKVDSTVSDSHKIASGAAQPIETPQLPVVSSENKSTEAQSTIATAQQEQEQQPEAAAKEKKATKRDQKKAAKAAEFEQQLIAMGGKYAESLRMKDKNDHLLDDEHHPVSSHICIGETVVISARRTTCVASVVRRILASSLVYR